MTGSGFKGLSMISVLCRTWNFWIKNWQNLDLKYQCIQVSLSFFISFFFSATFFLIENYEAVCFTGDHSI